MTPEALFSELIKTFVSEGSLNESKINLLRIQARSLEISEEALQWMIKIEQSKKEGGGLSDGVVNVVKERKEEKQKREFATVEYHSAITRGGSILTPDRLSINSNTLIYKKRNKNLINVDTLSIPLDRIASVAIDSSLLGTDIRISSYGAGEILLKKFTLSDAKEIKAHIEERSRHLK